MFDSARVPHVRGERNMTGFLMHALGWVLIVVGITAFGIQTWSGMRRIWRAEAGVGWFWDFFGAWLSATFFCGVGFGLLFV